MSEWPVGHDPVLEHLAQLADAAVVGALDAAGVAAAATATGQPGGLFVLKGAARSHGNDLTQQAVEDAHLNVAILQTPHAADHPLVRRADAGAVETGGPGLGAEGRQAFPGHEKTAQNGGDGEQTHGNLRMSAAILVAGSARSYPAPMSVAPRIAPSDLFTPEEWAPFQSRPAWIGPMLVAHCWAVIVLAVSAGVVWPILIPVCVMVVGTRQLGLAILMHEAAHGGLSKNVWLNDVLGHWLCAVPVGASLSAYRPYHLKHHRFAQQPEDPDLMLSAPFPVSPASLRRKMLRDLTGQTFFKQRVLLPLAMRGKARVHGAEHDYDSVVTGRSVVTFLLFNAGLLAVCVAAGVWWAFFVLWLLPMATWFPLVTRLRNIAEHACVEGSATDPFRAARTTRARWWERAFIAPYWVNFHAEHHLFMHVPCWSLPRLHRAIGRKPQARGMEVAGGYLEVLRTAASSGFGRADRHDAGRSIGH